MPKTTKQRRGEIVHALRGHELITPEDLRAAMEGAGVECKSSRVEYEEDLFNHKYITRVQGGWKLTPESRKDGIITIRVSPSQNKADVVKGITAAMKQFQPLVSMEFEL